MIYNWRKIVQYSLPLLTICVLIEIFAGQVLQGNLDLLVLFPIFLITIPVINSVGGNIGSVLGARLASGLHVGYISISLKDKEMKKNLLISILLGLITFIILGIIIYFVNYYITPGFLNKSLIFLDFIIIFISAGILLVFLVTLISIVTAFWSFKKGFDPDDMVAPIVTTVADVLGIIFLFLMIKFIGVA